MDEKTLDYYRENAEDFIKRTKDTEFNSMQDRFVKQLEPHARILDFGCGSGRDALAFRKRGFQVEAIDGTEAFARQAELLGIPSRHLLYNQFEDENRFDGIWACASLLHLSDEELSDTLARIRRALKPGGYFYCSMKEGDFQGMRDGRWFHDQTPDSLREILETSGFEIVELYESQDVRPEQKGRPWVNAISRKSR